MDAPVVARKVLRQVGTVHHGSMDVLIGRHINPIHAVTFGNGDHESETGVGDRHPEVLPS